MSPQMAWIKELVALLTSGGFGTLVKHLAKDLVKHLAKDLAKDRAKASPRGAATPLLDGYLIGHHRIDLSPPC
jgi:hypothetical protein